MNPGTGVIALLVAVLTAVSYWAGDHHRNNAWLAKQVTHERNEREALQAAQVRGDLLSAGLLTQASQIDQLKQESIHAIKQATTGRTCLGAAALRVLDQAPGITTAVMPAPASSAAAADERFASDTDIGLWAAEAGAHFETCRARLDALIDWHAP